ncbi:Crp/Fnr family transcriptional regulator [Sphingomonas sp. BAUL-RG-20F-R05-02]|uniref:Crp/Fnr family transcriptional regulator n=1 Tax=Sphingomonas sp. BAUL-RG-20F-R05-02 TaxID=2914830 RepID=UPI001F595284|nr:helix-turn-helix domain-containing protein [Sphingomonas sp. BAUL-RG-20F-R05-02]
MNVREQRLERPNLDCILHRLKLDTARDAGESTTIRGLWRSAEHHVSGSVVRLTAPRIITSGWAAWCRTTSDQRRVIFLFLLPGDVLTPAIGGGGNDCDLIAMTRLCSVDATTLTADAAPIAHAWINAADHEYRARLLDHLAWLNDGSALRNLARLLLELRDRVDATGRCVAGRFDMPIGQRVLAQALGLSAVQVNKMMQQLRDASLVSAERGWLCIDDEPALRDLAHGSVKSHQRPRSATPSAMCAATATAE